MQRHREAIMSRREDVNLVPRLCLPLSPRLPAALPSSAASALPSLPLPPSALPPGQTPPLTRAISCSFSVSSRRKTWGGCSHGRRHPLLYVGQAWLLVCTAIRGPIVILYPRKECVAPPGCCSEEFTFRLSDRVGTTSPQPSCVMAGQEEWAASGSAGRGRASLFLGPEL